MKAIAWALPAVAVCVALVFDGYGVGRCAPVDGSAGSDAPKPGLFVELLPSSGMSGDLPRYVRDPRTRLCFATDGAPLAQWRVLTWVPCDAVVPK